MCFDWTVFKKLDFNCDTEVIVTNIWFCTDIISTLVDKLNKGHIKKQKQKQKQKTSKRSEQVTPKKIEMANEQVKDAQHH